MVEIGILKKAKLRWTYDKGDLEKSTKNGWKLFSKRGKYITIMNDQGVKEFDEPQLSEGYESCRLIQLEFVEDG